MFCPSLLTRDQVFAIMRDKRFFQLSQGEWALVGVTMIWGTTFLIIRNALDVTGPLFFVGLRFGSAALALLVISLPILRGLTVHELFAGSLIGLSLLGGYALQSYGLVTISASKSAFITAFYVPAVPVLQWLFMRHRPSNMAWLGVGCALVGLILLAGPDGVSLGFGAGEMLTLLGAVACALEILFIGYFAGSVNVRRVTVVQVTVTSLLSFSLMPVVGESVPDFSWLLVCSACGLGVATALIQLVMNWAQKTISPTRATLIYAGEPVWAAIFGRMAGERLPFLSLVGGALVVAGVLISSARPGRGKKEKAGSEF